MMRITFFKLKFLLTAVLTALALLGCGSGGGGGVDTPPADPDGGPVATGDEIPADGTAIKTAKGVDKGQSFTFVVGPAGANINSNDGLFRLEIPAGAAAETTTFTVQPTENLMTNGLGSSYKFTPSLSSLKSTVTVIAMASLNDWVGASANPEALQESLGMAFQDATGQWRGTTATSVELIDDPFSVTNPVPVELSVKSALSSDPKWAKITDKISPRAADQAAGDELYESLGLWATARLQPVFTSVTKGNKVRLRLIGGGTDCNAPLPPSGLPRLCWGFTAKTPAVLGQPSAGEFKEISKDLFEYTAPNEIPAQNPVNLSITYSNLKGANPNTQIIFTAQVKVTDTKTVYNGKFNYKYEWLGLDDDSRYLPYVYEISGDVTLRYKEGLLGKGYEVEFANAKAESFSYRRVNPGPRGAKITCINPGGSANFGYFSEVNRAFNFANDGADKNSYQLQFAPKTGDYSSAVIDLKCSDGQARNGKLPPFALGTYTPESPFVVAFVPNPTGDDKIIAGSSTVQYALVNDPNFSATQGPAKITSTWKLVRVAAD